MDENACSESPIFNRLSPAKCEHLKPLSVYSRMITSDQKASLHHLRKLSNPFVNFKIEVVNKCIKKRKLDSSSPDGNYESPAKKSFNPKALSPDLGCFMDYCSPPERRENEDSPLSTSVLLDKTHAFQSEINKAVNFQLHSEHVECGPLTKSGGNKGTVPHSLNSKNVVLNLVPAFDCDIEGILCLNPVGTDSAGRFSENVESCKSSDTFQNKPVLVPTVARGQELERGDGQVEAGREELKTEMYVDVKDEGEDKGYFSMSYIKDHIKGKNAPQSEDLQSLTTTSSPLHNIVKLEEPQDESHPQSSSEQAVLSGQHVSFSVVGLCPTASGPPLGSVNFNADSLEDDVEEVWNIGPPMFESSLCHSVTVELSAGSEQSRHVTEAVQGGVKEQTLECQVTLSEEEATVDTSYETTLPLKVQVKSVVVAPTQLATTTTTTTTSKPIPCPLAKQNSEPTRPNPDECVTSGRSRRPAIFEREADWEREKRHYVHLVTRHINENPGADQDVMSELLNLMTHVADQTPGTNGGQWQHPSDLTRRNYQRRFGNMTPNIALHEWQAKNSTTHKRFAKVPKIFERSPFP